jgi:hypothetical protein
MEKKLLKDCKDNHPPMADRESTWCAKYGYFIDLDACRARSLNRPVCRRCYKSLLQLELPLGKT